MNNRLGAVVVGRDFFGRETELVELDRALTMGEHISLIAQRRTGKTSLLQEFARRESSRFLCLYLDLQGCSEGADAIVELAMVAREQVSLRTKVHNLFANVLGSVESLGSDDLRIQLRSGLVGDWRAKGDRLVADLSGDSRPVVLMLDELPVLLARMLRDEQGAPRPDGHARVDQLLSWLRKVALANGAWLRVVVTGSIGLEPITRQLGLSGTLNHYRPIQLEPWDPPTAMQALLRLGQHYKLSLDPDALQQVVDRLGSCIPYHVQLFFGQLYEDAERRKSDRVQAQDVGRVYRERLLSSRGHADLAHMEERLRWMLPPELHPLTLDLLTEAAVVGQLTPSSASALAEDHRPGRETSREALRLIYDVLEHDGYLQRVDEGSRRFVSKLLQDWWRRRFAEFYVPIAQRRAL